MALFFVYHFLYYPFLTLLSWLRLPIAIDKVFNNPILVLKKLASKFKNEAHKLFCFAVASGKCY